MTVRTLAEAAAEVLNRTRASAPSEPMHHMDAGVVDLGGSTLQTPQGTAIGAKASAVRGVATPPGKSVAQSTGEKMQKLPTQPGETMGSPTTSPEEEYNDAETAGHEYMRPFSEEEDTSEEDVIYEDESTEDESVYDESEELTEEEIQEALELKKSMVLAKLREMRGSDEDMSALFNGEELSEEFKTKASTIFESAVIARALPLIEEMETEILNSAQDAIEEIKAELEEQVDSYLNYMVEEWMNNNEVAIESGLKTEISESFIEALKNLFEEHYIDIPEDKVDVLETMAAENEELQSKLNEALNTNIELSQAIVEAKRVELVSQVCEGLTATQAEKVKTLAEGVEFTTEGDFVKKIGMIRENYFTSKSVKRASNNPIALTESEMPVQTSEVSSSMERYVNALSKTTPR